MSVLRLRADGFASRLTKPEAAESKWNLVFPRGEWHGANLAPVGGKLFCTDAFFGELIANWRAAGSPALPVTFHHVGEPTPGVSPEEERKAAGWFEDLRITEAGLEALTMWTPNARARINADEYRSLSPEWAPKHTDRHTGEQKGWWLYGAALLNDPFFNESPRVAAIHHPAATAKEQQMDPKMEACIAACKACIAACESGDSAAIAKACEACVAACEAMLGIDASCHGDKTTAQAIKDGAESVARPLRESLAAAAAKNDVLTAQVLKLVAEKFDADAKILCDELVRAGQILPVHREKVTAFAAKTSLLEAREVYGALPRMVPAAGELGIAGAGDEPDLAALQKQYEALLDEKVRAGAHILVAGRDARKRPEFRPLFAANLRSLSTNKEN